MSWVLEMKEVGKDELAGVVLPEGLNNKVVLKSCTQNR